MAYTCFVVATVTHSFSTCIRLPSNFKVCSNSPRTITFVSTFCPKRLSTMNVSIVSRPSPPRYSAVETSGNANTSNDNDNNKNKSSKSSKSSSNSNNSNNNNDKNNTNNNSNETTPLTASASNAEGEVSWKEIWITIYPFVFPTTWKIRLLALVSLIMVFANKVTNLIPPYLFKLAVDVLTNNTVNGSVNAPIQIVTLFVFFRLFNSLLGGLKDYTYAVVSRHNIIRFSGHVFEHLQTLSLAYHLNRKTGEIIRVMERGISSIDTVASTVLFTLLPTLFEAALVTTVFVKLGTPSIAITTFITVLIYFGFTFVFTKYRIRVRRDLIAADNLVSAKSVDTIMNFETVKSFGMEMEEVAQYKSLQKTYQDKYIRLRRSLMLLNFGQGGIQIVGLGVCLGFAAYAAAKGKLSPGDFVLVNSYVAQLFQPLFFLGTIYRQLTYAATDLEKSVSLLKAEITVKDAPDAVPLEMSEDDVINQRCGEVVFDNVSFKYDSNERGESGGLKNISFRVAPGKKIAFVGASGAGKSTIMRLLLRFYDVNEGALLIDGVDVRKLEQTSLRKRIGVVAQETVLFNATIRENISYGKPDATDAEIWHAARSAALGPFIESLPKGLDTMVGERGVRLSGGERQRVGCARCIIKSPAIVLLDEATSQIDAVTEREMQKNLHAVSQNRTTLVVAHRLSTIMMADEIIVLRKNEDDGVSSIEERGTHDELLELGGLYAGMWRVQTRLDEDEKKDIADSNGEASSEIETEELVSADE